MDKINKLSQAIRFGATLTEQAFDTYIKNGRRCALAAAMHGLEVARNWDFNKVNLWEKLKIDKDTMVDCSYCGTSIGLREFVIHLNDHHKWTREQIADFLESKGY